MSKRHTAKVIANAANMLDVLRTVRELAPQSTNLPEQCPALWIEICELLEKLDEEKLQ